MTKEIEISDASEIAIETPRRRVIHPVDAYVGQLSERSAETMRSVLDTTAAVAMGVSIATKEERAAVTGVAMRCVWWTLSRAEIVALQQRLIAHGYSPSMVNLARSAIRGVMREAYARDLISRRDLDDALAARPVRGTRIARGRMIPPHQLQALASAAERLDGQIGLRDLALVGMLGGGGLRRREASEALAENFDQSSGELRLVGKGNKERIVPFPPTPLAWIRRWLVARGDARGPILFRFDRATARHDAPISPNGVYKRVARLAKLAGVDPPPRPHDFRRTFISEMLRRADVLTVAKLVGHEQTETTRTYDLRPQEDAAKAVKLLDDIFGGKTPPKDEKP